MVWLLPVMVAGCDLDLTDVGRNCEFERDLSDFVDARTATAVLIDSEAGDLQVVGRADIDDVRVRAVACARDRIDLNETELVVQRTGEVVRVLGLVPTGAGVNARLDMVVEVPDWMLVDISDAGGDIEVAGVDEVIINDDSGDIVVEDILGDVDITDDSGELWVNNVGGDVFILDDSGTASVQDVLGSVVVEDGSGNLFVRDVDLDVHVVEDGSGDIVVENVGGDFTVELDGSGSISYRNIGGRVTLPR
jgi:hypothetical protein